MFCPLLPEMGAMKISLFAGKLLNTFVLTMEQTKAWNNQQETLAYLGGLWDGEGHFGISKLTGKNGKFSYKVSVAISNTDPALINVFTDFCDSENLAYHIRVRAESANGRRTQYEIQMTGLKSTEKFVAMIIPYLKGWKKDEAAMALRFVRNRIARNLEPPARHEDGRFVGNGKAPFTEEDVSLYSEYKKLKAPQRLHAIPRPSALQGKGDDIVQI